MIDGPDDEVVSASRQRGILATEPGRLDPEFDIRLITSIRDQRVIDGNRGDQRFQFMKTIITSRQDIETEVDLRGGPDFAASPGASNEHDLPFRSQDPRVFGPARILGGCYAWST